MPINRSINSLVALGFDIIYTLVGLAGFLVTGDVAFVGQEGDPLVVFDVNGLHNIVHLLIGVVLIGASRRTDTARSANVAIGGVYLLLGVLGPFINGTAVDVIGLNSADHVLHLVSGAALLGTGLVADKEARSRVWRSSDRSASRAGGGAVRRRGFQRGQAGQSQVDQMSGHLCTSRLAVVEAPLADQRDLPHQGLGVQRGQRRLEAAGGELCGEDVLHLAGDVADDGGEPAAVGERDRRLAHEDPEPVGLVLDVGQQGQSRLLQQLRDWFRVQNGRSPTAWQIELIDQVTCCSTHMRTTDAQKKADSAPIEADSPSTVAQARRAGPAVPATSRPRPGRVG